ncbi:tyrosine-type recombinase/integrase, partial [Aureibaculum sp. 2210JD6-5]|uniref:tyrosine-type recombinase/integrase n=1 Tax=Aureibaculum sp. 2210JD6-5 TaxID=3103957 RepID=UPI002AADDA7F
MKNNTINFISKAETQKLLTNVKNKKHKLIILLMLDCGMRVSETISLQLKNFDFKQRTVRIKSLKKKEKEKSRTIPLSYRLYIVLGEYLNLSKLELKPHVYLFPSNSKLGHIRRETVWKMVKRITAKLNMDEVHPHTLRHTFATHHLAAGTSLEEIKEMLGHESYDTTLIYTNISTKKLQERINQVTKEPPTLWEKIKQRFNHNPKPKLINLDVTESYFTIGRNKELALLNSNATKGVNT